MSGARWTEADLTRHTQKQSIKSIEKQKVVAKKNKFNNKKKEIDGITFDSTKEAGRYVDLKNQQMAGLIRDLRHQVEFELEVNGVKICSYFSDFVYFEVAETSHKRFGQVVEDVKSKVTREHPVYILKKKLMKAIHGIVIKEV